jgi:hypothetical protein
VLWALWSTTALPKGSFNRLWNYIKKVIRENKVATIIGALIGGVGTRFLEDGNLLVTTVLTGFSIGISVIFSLVMKLILK